MLRVGRIRNRSSILKAFFVIARALLSGAACFALAACSSVSGAGRVRVVEDAGTAEVPRYELVDVDSHVVEILRHRGPDSFLAHFGDYRPSVERRISIGDTVSVTIWEAGPGGLFSAPLVSDRFSTGANADGAASG
jgi:polysaccharide biosynthesis/export protein